MTSNPPSPPHLVTSAADSTARRGDTANEGGGWHVFLHFQVRDHATQQAFIDAYRPVIDQHVQGWAGFLGATLYASTDGTRVINHTRWVDEATYQHYLDASDSDARLQAIQAAFDRVPEVAGPEMTMVHTYEPRVVLAGNGIGGAGATDTG
jgi:C-6 monooxygenase